MQKKANRGINMQVKVVEDRTQMDQMVADFVDAVICLNPCTHLSIDCGIRRIGFTDLGDWQRRTYSI